MGIIERKKIPTFKAAINDFLAWSEQEHRAHLATHRRYRVSSIALLRYFKDVSLDKITAEDVERFKAARAAERKTARLGNGNERKQTKKGIRPATVNRELACLKALFNSVIKSGAILKNPVSGVNMLAENNLQTRVLSFTEQHDYLAKATPVLRDVATIILETGMRPEEVYTIRPENLDLVKSYIQIPHRKTAAARRRLRLTATAKEVLTRRISGMKDSPFLFHCGSDPKRPIPKVNNAHDRAVRDSKVAPFRLYDLRHTWATRAAMSGIDPVTLAAMLGHSRIQMVLRYAHPTQEHQSTAMDRLEQYNAMQQIAEFERREGMTQ